MKQPWARFACLAIVLFLQIPGLGRAQSTLDELDKDLADVKQQHEESSAQNLNSFANALDEASRSPDAAVDLYQRAGGVVPTATPVKTKHEHETQKEKEDREAKDEANLASLGAVLQMQFGLMRFAALLVTNPDLSTLHDSWVGWLKNAAQAYPQLNGQDSLRQVSMRNSSISGFLGFQGWGDKEQGDWRVADVPRLYKENVLDPLRQAPSAATLDAWNAYIAMENADEPDSNKWNQMEGPSLQFDRDSDDFASAPSTDKIETLIAIIKANPAHPQADDWIVRVHAMVQSYRARQTGSVASLPSTPSNFVQPDPPASATPVVSTPVK